MFKCACGSGNRYGKCCEPYLKGTMKPSTAEALLRSRYTAFAKHNINYIIETISPGKRKDHDKEEIRKWSESSEWKGLEIVSVDGGSLHDSAAVIDFIAHYKMDNEEKEHHEVAQFKKQDGQWYFVDGRVKGGEPVVRETPKIGRNDPCSCGSKKKYKKCCGK